VRRLQQARVITGFSASVDLKSVGRALDAFIDLRLLPTTDPDEFERAVLRPPAVREVAFVTGRFDYHVRAACIDAEDLDRTVRALRQRAGAAHTYRSSYERPPRGVNWPRDGLRAIAGTSGAQAVRDGTVRALIAAAASFEIVISTLKELREC